MRVALRSPRKHEAVRGALSGALPTAHRAFEALGEAVRLCNHHPEPSTRMRQRRTPKRLATVPPTPQRITTASAFNDHFAHEGTCVHGGTRHEKPFSCDKSVANRSAGLPWRWARGGGLPRRWAPSLWHRRRRNTAWSALPAPVRARCAQLQQRLFQRQHALDWVNAAI